MEKKESVTGFLILAILIFGVVFLLKNISSDIWVGLMALLSSGVLVYLQKRKEEREHRNWLLRNKEAYLTDIVDLLISSIQDKESSEKVKQAKLLKRLKHLKPALMLWGSPSFIRAWDLMQQMPTGVDSETAIATGEKFFRAIRKELEHDDSSLKPGEISATILLKHEDKQIALDACKNEVYEQVKKNANS